jgi:hypothetical protein
MKAWDAIADLLGGADRVDEEVSKWGDSFIVNLGTKELENQTDSIDPKDLGVSLLSTPSLTFSLILSSTELAC